MPDAVQSVSLCKGKSQNQLRDENYGSSKSSETIDSFSNIIDNATKQSFEGARHGSDLVIALLI